WEEVRLTLGPQKASGTLRLRLASADTPAVVLTFQPVIVDGSGRTRYSQPSQRRFTLADLKQAGPTTNPPPKSVAKSPTPRPTTGTDLKVNFKGSVKELPVKSPRLPKGRTPPCLCWAEDGKSFFSLDATYTVRRIALGTFQVEKQLEVVSPCTWLSPSAEGLLLTLDNTQEVWLLDAASLEVKLKFDV